MTAAAGNLVVWAERKVLPEAKEVLAKLGARVHVVPLEGTRGIPASDAFVFYLHGGESEPGIASALRNLKARKDYGQLVLYVANRTPDYASRLGMLVGRELGTNADFAFDIRHLRQLLKARNLLPQGEPVEGFKIAAARARLGLTQEQMASALNITARTLQNWERGKGTSQLARKTKDLRELLRLMDDYVLAPKEREWLASPLPALGGRAPRDLIVEARLRDLIVEFKRLREGQPI